MKGIIVQARMNSKRLPNKILYKVNGKPMIQYLLESLMHCSGIDCIVVATSNETTDDPLALFCQNCGIDYYRGSLNNVGERFVNIIEKYNFDTFVRISGDSPLLDYRLVDKALKIFSSGTYDFVTNVLRRTYPKGQSVEVIDSSVFKKVYPLIKKTSDKEHVTPYFYANHEKFSIYNFESGRHYEHIQLSVDTPNDMIRFKKDVNSLNKPHWEYFYTDFVD